MRSIIVSLTITALLLSVAVGTYVTTALRQKSVTHAAPANTAVTTYKNDLSRTGQNTHGIILNTSNVNQSQFGKRVEYQVDGQVYAQPLFLPNVTINGTIHNVAFVATEHDSLYAFDADSTSSTPITTFLWHRSFINPPVITTVSSTNVSCTDITPEYGITGTPVIDPSTNTIYVVANTRENGVNTYRLHAIDLTTGNDKPNSPVLIRATSGTTFNAAKQMNRPDLLLLNGVVYIGWGSHCDNYPYNGWIMGYNASTYQQQTVFNVTPNGTFGAVWQAGQGLAADSAGNIYVMTGNGPFDANTGGPDYGDSFVKLSTTGGLKAIDYFAPFNQSCLNSGDIDLGSGGPLLLPTSHEMVSAGKEGRIYVVSRDFLGGYTADPTLNCTTTEQNRTDIDKVLQELSTNTANGGLFGSPSYWNGPAGEFVYVVGVQDHAKAFQLTSGKLSTAPTSQSPEKFGYPGGDIAVSSNGVTTGTGIAWTIAPGGTLYAYDATNLGTELYNSGQNPSRDKLPGYAKFTVPTITNGEVFVGTSSTLDIFGLLSTSSTAPVISSLSPTSGLVGTSVTLTGSHFGTTQGTSTVSFGSTSASVTTWSDTSIVVTVPSSLAQGAVKVTVTVAGKISNSQTFTVTSASTAYNNTGISDDSNPQAADINGAHQSYSAQALLAANISPVVQLLSMV